MSQLKETETYGRWIDGLRDKAAQVRIVARTKRLLTENAGDHKKLSGGISELRIDYGPGYRVYYTRHGSEIILLLAGGDKRTQTKDIETARRLAKDYKDGDMDD